MKYHFLLLVFFISVSITAVAQDLEVGGLKYKLLGEGKLELVGGNVSGQLLVPEHVDFRGRELIVTQIGEDAFAGTELTTVRLPSTVKVIGERAFKNSTVSSINFPFGLYLIGKESFENTRLDSIFLPRTLCYHPRWKGTGVEEFAFRGCKNLKVVEFDDAGHPADGYNVLLSPSEQKDNEPIRVYAGAFDDCDNIEKVIYNGEAPVFDPYVNNCKSKTFPKMVLEFATLYCQASAIGSKNRFLADRAMDGFATVKPTAESAKALAKKELFSKQLVSAIKAGKIGYDGLGNFVCGVKPFLLMKGDPVIDGIFSQDGSTVIILNKKKNQEIKCRFLHAAESLKTFESSFIPGETGPGDFPTNKTEIDAISNDDFSIIIFKSKTSYKSMMTSKRTDLTQYCLWYNNKVYRIKDKFFPYLNQLFKEVDK